LKVKGAIAPPAITLLLPETVEYFQALPEYSSVSGFTKGDPQIVRFLE
jgi:hypothetical protein